MYFDLSTLPPCHFSLLLHIKRANYAAAMWNTHYESILLPEIHDGSIGWVDQPFPDDINELLLNEDEL
jgi:hypothetical protein